MYDYNYLVTLTEQTNEKLDDIKEEIHTTNVFSACLLIFLIVAVLLSMIKG